MNVPVHGLRCHPQVDHGDGEPVLGNEFARGGDDSVVERTVAHRTAVDEEIDCPGGRLRPVRGREKTLQGEVPRLKIEREKPFSLRGPQDLGDPLAEGPP
jgi:hypothetical protein